ncbi:autotransporter-associated beta strand repeat-containing protein [Coraliomargarita sp. W4R53]
MMRKLLLPATQFSLTRNRFLATSLLLCSASVVTAQTTRTWDGSEDLVFNNYDNWTPDGSWTGSDVLRFDGSVAGDLDLSLPGASQSRVLYEFTSAQTGDVSITMTDSTGRGVGMGNVDGEVAISIAAGAGKVTFDGNSGGDMILLLGNGSGNSVLTIQNEGILEFGSNVNFKAGGSDDWTAVFTGGGQTTFNGSNIGGMGGGLRVEGDHVLIMDDANIAANQLLAVADQARIDFTTVNSIGGDKSAWSAIRLGNNVAGQGILRYTGTGDVNIIRKVQIGNGVSGDNQVASARIENESATGKLVFNNASFNNTQGGALAARTLTLGGSNAMDNEITGVIADNSTANGATVSVIKADAGKWILSGQNSYTGATLVEQGTLAIGVGGSISDSAAVIVSDGATFDVSALTSGFTLESGQLIGGDGTVAGDLNFASGAHLIFDTAATLMVTGDVSFDDSFSVASLLSADGEAIDWSTIAAGTYTLLDNDSTFNNISNFGAENAAALSGGRSAYFQEGSLELVVVVPEPSTYALIGGVLALVCVVARRKRV